LLIRIWRRARRSRVPGSGWSVDTVFLRCQGTGYVHAVYGLDGLPPRAAHAIFFKHGQHCAAGSRLILTRAGWKRATLELTLRRQSAC